jgi:TonB family protein
MKLLLFLTWAAVSPAMTAAQSTEPPVRQGPGVTVPRLVRDVKPQYTSDAMRRQIQGSVQLECVVQLDGTPASIKVVRSLDPELDEQAIKALQQWRFQPGTKDGRPVPVIITAEMTFTLGGPKAAPAAADAPIRVFSRLDVDGSTLAYDISRERLTNAPSWDPQTTAQPPLSVGEAIAEAKRWLQEKRSAPEATDYRLLSALLMRFAGGASDRWSYQITLSSGAIAVTVIVLLDGSIVEPRHIPRQP